jgi:large subunit ribosomal protein L18
LSRRTRVRKKISGTTERPRLSVYRSLSHIYAQVIDDVTGKTLASASSLKLIAAAEPEPAVETPVEGKKSKKGKKKAPLSAKIRLSVEVGKAIAEKAKANGIETVVFDRNGFLYHGRVAALADAARKNGLKF